MGRVIQLPSISQYSTTSWDSIEYENLSAEQKANFDYLENNGLYIFDVRADEYTSAPMKYGAVTGSSVYFAMYGTSERLLGYYRKGNGHFVANQFRFPTRNTNYNYIEVSNTPYNRVFESGVHYITVLSDDYIFATAEEALSAIGGTGVYYPITYDYTNSTVTGVSEAAVGETVVVSAVPNNNYGITDAASQILVTNNDVAVQYQWNPTTNTITFTMPDPVMR